MEDLRIKRQRGTTESPAYVRATEYAAALREHKINDEPIPLTVNEARSILRAFGAPPAVDMVQVFGFKVQII